MNKRPFLSHGARRAAVVLAASVCFAASTGCAPSADGGAAAEVDALRTEVTQLRGALARLDTMESELADLQSLEEIRELFVDYGRTLDDRDFEAFGGLFARDSQFIGGGNTEPAQGPEAIAAMLQQAISRNASGANLHIFLNEKVAVDGDQATAISRGAWVGQDDEGLPKPLIYATYEDELVREDGRWKFKSRRIIGDIPGPPNESR